MAIKFANASAKSGLQQKKELNSFITTQIKKECNKASSLQYIFVSDEELHTMNQQFLNHDTLTDIITFDLSETDNKILGEIYISVDRVKDNAQKFGVEYLHELHRVIFHGALHLCGYKDKTPVHKKQMSAKEDEWLSGFGFE
jgi:probable rRNA maturation factor